MRVRNGEKLLASGTIAAISCGGDLLLLSDSVHANC